MLSSGVLEGAGGTFRRGRLGRAGAAASRAHRTTVREVEAGLEACASAGDVTPLLEGALVAEENEGAIDVEALGGVSREGIAVVEMLGRVLERNAPVAAGLVADDQRAPELDDGSAYAISQAEPRVVAAAEDLV